MSEIIDVSYTERTLPIIASEIKTIEEVVYRTTLEGVIQIGRKLEEAKEQCGHGNFTEWCEKELNYSQRQAQRYIEISSKYGDENSPFSKATMSSFLSISKAYSLLALPEEEVETFVEKHEIDDMTVKELEQEIKELKKAKETEEQNLRGQIDQLEKEKKTAHEAAEVYRKDLEELKKSGEELIEAELKKEKDRAEEELKEKLAEKEAEITSRTEKEMEALKRQINNSDPDVIIFKERFGKLQDNINDIRKLINDSPEKEKFTNALKQALTQLIDSL